MLVEWSYTIVIYGHHTVGFKEREIIFVPGKGTNAHQHWFTFFFYQQGFKLQLCLKFLDRNLFNKN